MSSQHMEKPVSGRERPSDVPAHPQRRTMDARHVVIFRMTRVLNPLIRRLAGRRHVRFFALVQHRGRRSGRVYSTPVSARQTSDGFVIPMTFGQEADWFRNVQAAGGCVVRWNGSDYPVIEPEIIPMATARLAFSRVEQALVPVIGIEQFVRLRHAPGGDRLPDASSHAGARSGDDASMPA